MANQDFTRKNKKPTTHDKQKRLAEEELEKRISRLQLAIKKEKAHTDGLFLFKMRSYQQF